jgi:hypothetical protein
MFLRIFPAKRTRRFVCIGIVLSVLLPIAFGLPMVFACRPISGAYAILEVHACLYSSSLTSYVVSGAWTSWDAETPVDHCINQFVFWLVAAGYNIFVDIYIVVIPIPELLKLNLSTRKKTMLLAIFSTGAM